jgi:hypothetical protein
MPAPTPAPAYVATPAPAAAAPAGLPQTGLDLHQTAEIVKGVYGKIYQHIFTQCGFLINSDVAFANPEAATTMPIALTDQEKQVVVRCDCQTEMGQWAPNTPTTNGLRGSISKDAKLPMYTIFINEGGVEKCRRLVPQNPAKMVAGQFTKPALAARGGSQILYVFEGDKAVADATGKSLILKIQDNQIIPC